MPDRKDKPKEKTQRERFIETAREVEVDESADAFEKAFNKITNPPSYQKKQP